MKLQFTNGYLPHFDQISRIMQFVQSKDGVKRVSTDDIKGALGMPRSQVEYLISMMTGFGLVQPRVTTLTALGKAITQADPFFEKLETLWVIHYIVSSNPEYVAWYRIVNMVIPLYERYRIDTIKEQYFTDLSGLYSEKTLQNKLGKEIGTVFAAYTRGELGVLHIVETEGMGNYLRGNPVDVPDLAFLFSLLHYRNAFLPGSSAVNIEGLCIAVNGPGRVLNLPEYIVRGILGRLHDSGLIRMEQMANLDQVRISEALTEQEVLVRIYGALNAD